MNIRVNNVYWGSQGEPYKIPCLRLTINGLPASIGLEQKPAILAKDILHVSFDDFQDEDQLPEIIIDADPPGIQKQIRLTDFIASRRLADYLRDLKKAIETDDFIEGKIISRQEFVV